MKTDPDSAILPKEGLVPIRTVASLTGVNPVTLRAWERRYGLIKPVRTPKGHRLYSMSDVDLINKAVALLEGGMSIGQVRQVLSAGESRPAQEQPPDSWVGYQKRLIQAIGGFDSHGLDEVYNEALSLYPVDIVTTRLIVPLLQELGSRWEQGQGSVAEEHFFSVYLRNKLGARLHHRSRSRRGPRLLAACLAGEQHEVGILLFALTAADRGYRVILLGANMPLQELPAVVDRSGCRAIVLSGTVETPIETLRPELAKLVRQVKAPIFIGGKISIQHPKELVSAGAIALGDDLNLALHKIDAVLARD